MHLEATQVIRRAQARALRSQGLSYQEIGECVGRLHNGGALGAGAASELVNGTPEIRDREAQRLSARYRSDPEPAKDRAKAWNTAHPERSAERQREFRLRHRPQIRKEARERAALSWDNDERVEEGRRKRQKCRLEAIEVLGGLCVICGENDPRLLDIDHIKAVCNGGQVEPDGIRRSGPTWVRWLLANPELRKHYQLLCKNHHWLKTLADRRKAEDVRREERQESRRALGFLQ